MFSITLNAAWNAIKLSWEKESEPVSALKTVKNVEFVCWSQQKIQTLIDSVSGHSCSFHLWEKEPCGVWERKRWHNWVEACSHFSPWNMWIDAKGGIGGVQKRELKETSPEIMRAYHHAASIVNKSKGTVYGSYAEPYMGLPRRQSQSGQLTKPKFRYHDCSLNNNNSWVLAEKGQNLLFVTAKSKLTAKQS